MAATAGLAGIPALTSEHGTGFQYISTGSVGAGGLTIKARNGHRRTLVDIFFEAETAGLFLDVQIGDKIWNRIPTTFGDYSALSNTPKGIGMVKNEAIKIRQYGFLWWLSQYIPFDFPSAAQDEPITITPVVSLSYGAIPGSYVISALYKDQDGGDVVSKTVPGGSSAPRKLFFDNVTNSLSQATAGQTALDAVVSPAGLGMFKDNDNTPAGYQFLAYMFAYDASALGVTTGANANGKPTRLHVTDIDIQLFTPEDTEGLLLDRDLANVLAFDLSTETVFRPTEPYLFDQNRRIRMLLDTAQKAGAGANFGATTQLFSMVGIRQPVGGP